MLGAEHLPAYARAQLPAWYYLGGETISAPDDQALTLPSTCSAITLSVEDGACYYAINGAASTLSGGYIPEGGMQTVGPIANLTSFHIHGTDAVVHVQYWKEA